MSTKEFKCNTVHSSILLNNLLLDILKKMLSNFISNCECNWDFFSRSRCKRRLLVPIKMKSWLTSTFKSSKSRWYNIFMTLYKKVLIILDILQIFFCKTSSFFLKNIVITLCVTSIWTVGSYWSVFVNSHFLT